MNITHLVWGMPRGGLESMLVDICNIQCEAANVQVVIVNNEIELEVIQELDSRVKIARVMRPRGSRNPWYVAKTAWYIKSFRSDVVHAHHVGLGRIARYAGTPALLTIHDTVFEDGPMLGHFERICAISNSVREAVKTVFPGIPCDLVVNGIVPSRITRLRGCAKENGSYRIVQISRLELPKKGQDLLIEALCEVQRHLADTKIQLDFIGDGPARLILEAQVARLNLTDKVSFLGKLSRENVYDRLADYDLLIQPSRYEGFGLTVVEAMVANVPVLVSDIEGPAEIVGGGKYGDMFKANDVEDLARELLVAIRAKCEESRHVRTEQARRMAVDMYDVKRTADEYRRIYALTIER